MKKLLLGLGTLSLAILPVAAMVSCSTETKPTLEAEAEKFNVSVASKLKDVTTTDVAKEINEAKTPETRLVAVEKYATLPTMAEGFTLEIKSAIIKAVELSTVVEVIITVTETTNTDTATNSKDVLFSISELMIDQTIPTLASEAEKFSAVTTTSTDVTAITAAAAIVALQTQEERMKEVAKYATLPVLSDGFTFEIVSAPTGDKMIGLKILIKNTLGGELEITWIIQGFAAAK